MPSKAEIDKAYRLAETAHERLDALSRRLEDVPHYGPHARAELAHTRIDALSKAVNALVAAVDGLEKRTRTQGR